MQNKQNPIEVVMASLNEAKDCLDQLMASPDTIKKIVQASELMASSFASQNKVYSCGNGGSMCDAMHFAEELTGRFRSNRPGLAALAISDPGHMSCVSNDFGYDQVFSRFIEAHGRKGDILLGISTSGKSPNVLLAAKAAKKLGVHVIALTGKHDCSLAELADIHIATPGGVWADRVQELHIKVIHSLIDLIERRVFP